MRYVTGKNDTQADDIGDSRELRADVDPANEGVVVVHLKTKRVRIVSPMGEPVLFA